MLVGLKFVGTDVSILAGSGFSMPSKGQPASWRQDREGWIDVTQQWLWLRALWPDRNHLYGEEETT